jgi:hypothetical protein
MLEGGMNLSVKAELSWDSIAEDLELVYEEVLNQPQKTCSS